MSSEHITISSVAPRIQYEADGQQTEFVYPFAIFETGDLKVFLGDTEQVTGFTVSGAGQSSGGEVVFAVAPAPGTLVTLLRVVPVQRTTDFQAGGAFRAKTVNDELDRQVAMIQQVVEAVDRVPKLRPTASASAIELPEPSPGRFLKWNGTGDNLENSSRDADALLAEAAAARDLAEEWANQSEDTEITGNPGEFSARHWAMKAQSTISGTVVRATLQQAEEGADNETFMTPLRARQHFDARLDADLVVTGRWDFESPVTRVSRSGDAVQLHLRRTDQQGDGEAVGRLSFRGKDDADNEREYAALESRVADDAGGAEDGRLDFLTVRGGALSARLRIGDGLYAPAALGGDKGIGAGNFTRLYQDGVAVQEGDRGLFIDKFLPAFGGLHFQSTSAFGRRGGGWFYSKGDNGNREFGVSYSPSVISGAAGVDGTEGNETFIFERHPKPRTRGYHTSQDELYGAEYLDEIADVQALIDEGFFDEVTGAFTTRNITMVHFASGATLGAGRNHYMMFHDEDSGSNFGQWILPNAMRAGGLLDLRDPDKKPIQVVSTFDAATNQTNTTMTCYWRRADGRVVTSGYNGYGQRSLGTTTNAPFAVAEQTGGDTLTDIIDLYAFGGQYGTCYAWDGTGQMWGVGRNSEGQLMDGTTTNRWRFQPVSSFSNPLTKASPDGRPKAFKVIGGNTYWSAYMLHHNGDLEVAGSPNTYGQLGDGTSSARTDAVHSHADVESLWTSPHIFANNGGNVFVNKWGMTIGFGANNARGLGTGYPDNVNPWPRVVWVGDINMGLYAEYGGHVHDPTGGSIRIGDMIAGNGLDAAFRRDDYDTVARKTVTVGSGTAYIGLALGSPRALRAAYWKPSRSSGFFGTGPTSATFRLYGRQGAAPANSGDGTVLDTILLAANSTVRDLIFRPSDTTTEWDHVWIECAGLAGADGDVIAAGIGFIGDSLAENPRAVALYSNYGGSANNHGTIARSSSGIWWQWGYNVTGTQLPFAKSGTSYPANPDWSAMAIFWPVPDAKIKDIRLNYRDGEANGYLLDTDGYVYTWGYYRALAGVAVRNHFVRGYNPNETVINAPLRMHIS